MRSDFLIVGAGIAGASVAYWLAPHGRVTLIEREAHPGYHATGRSAALFMESYGPPQVRALSRASLAFLQAPPDGFCDRPLLTARGALTVACAGQQACLDAQVRLLESLGHDGRVLDAEQTCAMVPILRRERIVGSVLEADAADIDVHALHQGFLRDVRRQGGEIVCDTELLSAQRIGDTWRAKVRRHGSRQEPSLATYEAPVLIDAAGAWGDLVAERAGVAPLGLQPKRRSAFVFEAPAGCRIAHWPMVMDAASQWYFKPDAGLLLGSPANADPVPPQDVQPEELDIATAIDRIEAMTTLSVGRPRRTWAGLRSFVPDGQLVGGFDVDAPGFFWIVGQGGYGIQTAAAMGEACASLVRDTALPAHLTDVGLNALMLGPRRPPA